MVLRLCVWQPPATSQDFLLLKADDRESCGNTVQPPVLQRHTRVAHGLHTPESPRDAVQNSRHTGTGHTTFVPSCRGDLWAHWCHASLRDLHKHDIRGKLCKA